MVALLSGALVEMAGRLVVLGLSSGALACAQTSRDILGELGFIYGSCLTPEQVA